ncbi:hypothetical protein BS50DRAFT_604582 [Corynespora cassiicola Philippines]|uniref:Fms interacting protein n=1 Tax=Corynespora cassiicola Philippines TaxID=1448308 RepID=A0A2T2N572_CORCC|nr:hypothetical protein BS50DRAFT_604582 [Corynespora cassiicola Philippines]
MEVDIPERAAPAADSGPPAELADFILQQKVDSPHNKRALLEIAKMKELMNDVLDYVSSNPRNPNPTTPEEIEQEKQFKLNLAKKEKRISAQVTLIKNFYRKSVLKTREEKAQTAEARAVNDALILDLHNLKYEEQSLRSEIAAAENYDHKYTKLPLISVEEFLELFPEHKNASEHELMTARIEHERAVRVELEERRQEKLKQKQKLIAEVKKGKDDLTKLDGMVESFIEAAEPIKKVLNHE